MQRRHFLKLGAAASMFSLSGLSFFGKARAAAEKKWNILWISCEDIGPRIGSYGDNVADTPNLDALAAEGMRFDHVFTTSPVCAPVRSGIITGMYPTTIGTHNMRTSHKGRTGELPTPYQTVPPAHVKAFPEYLRAAGYYCTNNKKTDYQFADFSYTPVSIWDDCSDQAHWKNRPDKNQPFFAVFNSTLTHESKTWQEPSMTDPDLVSVPPYYPDTRPVRKAIARLYDQIHKMDQWAGNLLKELEQEGEAENTIVFFWGDHGDGLLRGKRWLYDSGTRIPLIIKWPGQLKSGSTNDDLISSIDFGATVLSMADVEIPAYMQGRAFLGDQKGQKRQWVFSHRDRFDESYDMMRSVRDKRYLYVRNYYTNKPYVLWVPYRNNSPIMTEMLRLQAENALKGPQKLWFSDKRPPEELYDCQADPHQINNLARDAEYSEIMEKLSATLETWRRRTGDLGDIPESELKHRWWPGGVQPHTQRVWLIPNAPSNRGRERIQGDSAEFQYPAMIGFYCATEGASIVYTTETGEAPHWKLVTGPLRLPRGKTLLRSKAIRYGYKESPETACMIHVK
ncbi:MAG: sulfatase [candidate division KSB1 bacterium]|nr:sulfatase [candidate division KSB1 bacterium]